MANNEVFRGLLSQAIDCLTDVFSEEANELRDLNVVYLESSIRLALTALQSATKITAQAEALAPKKMGLVLTYYKGTKAQVVNQGALEYDEIPPYYLVREVTNTTSIMVGQRLSPDEVYLINERPDWVILFR